MRIYLDNAATTEVDTEVLEAMLPYLKGNFGNPSSIHSEGRIARAAIESARKNVAKLIGASIGEIFFTSGGTESNNMALKCAVRDLGVTRIISSKIEHHCVLHSAESLQKQKIQLDFVALDTKGRVLLDELESLLAQTPHQKTLVSLMHANNEIGTKINLEKIAALCHSYNAYFHSDTVQTVGHFPIDVEKIKLDFLSGSAHKFHGPKGVGFIYISKENQIQPFIDGGSQERNMRGGTENISGIVGLSKSLELAVRDMQTRREKIESLKNQLVSELLSNFEDIKFNGDWAGDTLYTVLSVSFPNTTKTDLLLLNLDIAGISASGGSACSSGVDAGSHVLAAIDSSDLRRTIRFSFSHHNTSEEINFLVNTLKMYLK